MLQVTTMKLLQNDKELSEQICGMIKSQSFLFSESANKIEFKPGVLSMYTMLFACIASLYNFSFHGKNHPLRAMEKNMSEWNGDTMTRKHPLLLLMDGLSDLG